MRGPFLIPIVVLAFFSGECFAKTVRLFRNPNAFETAGIPVALPEYEDSIRFLAPGDEIEFTQGKKIRIGKKLGTGGTTAIYEVADSPNQAIRLPKGGQAHQKFISFFAQGYETLAREGVPVVRMHESLPYEYAIVDRLPGKVVTMADWLDEPAIVSPSRAQEMKDGFIDFAKKLAPFKKIGDFGPDQIAYDPASRQWILFDWLQSHESALSKNIVGLTEWSSAPPPHS